MAEEQINVDITASDKASDKLEDVADLVEDLEKAKPEITVEADTKAAAGDLEQLSDDAAALDKLTPKVDVTADTSTADGDLKATRDLAEQLAKADAEILVRAKIDDAKANLKELRGELDRLTGGGGGGGSPITAATIDTDNYTGATGRAKDATHSFVGNAITELPGVGTAFGPASEAIAQLTEGVLAGEIAVKGLAMAAGAIAGIGAAVMLITSELAEIEKTRAFHRGRVDEFADALRDAEDAADALKKKLAKDEKVEFISDGDTRDAVDSLAKINLKIEDFTALVESGQPGIDAWAASMRDKIGPAIQGAHGPLREINPDIDKLGQLLYSTNPEIVAYAEVLLAAQQASTDLGDATTSAEERAKVFGDTAKDAATKAKDLGDESKWAAQQLKDVGDNADDAAPRVDKLRKAYETLIGELADRSAYRGVEDAFANLDAAAVAAFTAVQTNAADADQAVRDHEAAVDEVKQAVADYAIEVGGIPEEKFTSIIAQIERGEYQKVLDELAALEKQREVILKIISVTDDRGYGPAGGPRDDTFGETPTGRQLGETVNVYMPTGSTGTDVLRVLNDSTRRSGGLFGGP